MNKIDLRNTRHKNLMFLIAEKFSGSLTDFSAAAKKNPTQVNHWISGHRNPNGDTCRDVERELDYPEGWLDQDHSHPPSATPPETGNYPLANSHKKTALAPVQKAQGAISFDDAVRVMAEFLMPVDASTSEMVMTVLGRLAQYPDEHERIARAAMAVLESGKRRAA
jgi:hypothetical protein